MVRHEGELRHETQPDRERPTSRVDHRVTEHHGARGRRREDPAFVPRRLQRLPQGRVLEHRAQVHGRAAGHVGERALAHGRDVGFVLGVGPAQHHESARPTAQGREPLGGLLDQAPGMLVGGRGRQHEHLGPTGGGK